MTRLTLGGIELDLTISQKGDYGFTVSSMHWQTTAQDQEVEANTLILTTVAENAEEDEEDEETIWHINGSVLRQMNKSGMEYLVLRAGDQIVSMDTGGFLAGWVYDELKSRGTGSRQFEYEITMDGSASAWRVQVEDQEYTLMEDPHAGLFLNRVYTGSAEALNDPLDSLFPRDDS